MSTDYDSPWKDFLQQHLRWVFDLLFPPASAQIDWGRGFEFLEQELRQILPENERIKRIADALVKVYLLDGKEQWVLIHIEVQGQRDDEFPERMFVSFYRIFDRYKRHIAGFAILSDDDPNWQSNEFISELLGTKESYQFNIAKLITMDPAVLASSENPFAWVVMAHRAAQQTSKNAQARLRMKIRLTQDLAQQRYSKEAIRDLYRFMDWVMQLPEAERIQYKDELRKLEGESMKYISTIEQIALAEGIEKGLSQGLEQGLEKGRATERIGLIMRLLERLIGPVDAKTRETIERMSANQQRQLAEDLLDFKQPSDLQTWLTLFGKSQ